MLKKTQESEEGWRRQERHLVGGHLVKVSEDEVGGRRDAQAVDNDYYCPDYYSLDNNTKLGQALIVLICPGLNELLLSTY